MLTCYTVYVLDDSEIPSSLARSSDSDEASNTSDYSDTSDKEQAPYEGKRQQNTVLDTAKAMILTTLDKRVIVWTISVFYCTCLGFFKSSVGGV